MQRSAQDGPKNFHEAMEFIVDTALGSSAGEGRIADAREFLERELARHHFNTERAVEVFTIAVDNAVWAGVKDMPMGRSIYNDYKAMALGPQNAQRLTRDFIEETGAGDQRRPRRLLRWLLGA